MGLRADIQADIAEAFDADLADAVDTFTASHPGAPVYDPATGGVTAAAVAYTGRGVLDGYLAEQVDGTLILATDKQLIALQSEVTRAPAVGDTIAGLSVVRVEQDPAAATWICQLRA